MLKISDVLIAIVIQIIFYTCMKFSLAVSLEPHPAACYKSNCLHYHYRGVSNLDLLNFFIGWNKSQTLCVLSCVRTCEDGRVED
jgi:hypothetical protein